MFELEGDFAITAGRRLFFRGSRRWAFEFRLIRRFLVLDRQRSIVDSHFSIMLLGNWIGRSFC
jgi:hypothetical protein